ncbi:metallophosphoesterase family protein [Deinococcus maricopensis]|uniref:Phosphoesterase n=1 Tax=Deinococcus maricopensis (strain DSM 21211 / LMG 22137 / NRRL B-23946 / LB-34) TaxID=709986 RepID=E8U7K8_DEIML|nr:metallophosphoesterase family protein [Deinococcus maricopensis]ADV67047.1 phosphodiesterase, MJ0936 family [Deinococcus maricopensis DSM 21211]
MENYTVGVISDTHGLLRPEVEAFLAGVDLILHAGDVGRADLLTRLNALAPTLAVRGNVDRSEGVRTLPLTVAHELPGGVWIYMLHDLNDLDLVPEVAGFRVVVSGHSHVPRAVWRGEVLFLNPGSCGPRRFRLPVAAARLRVGDDGLHVEEHTFDL